MRRSGLAHAAQQEAREHQPRPRVFDQQQVNGEQLGFSAGRNASAKNAAFIAAAPASSSPPGWQ
jgi:hypothetical protein